MDCFDAAHESMRKLYDMRFIGSGELRVALLAEDLVVKSMRDSAQQILDELDDLYRQEAEQPGEFITSLVKDKQLLFNYVHHMLEARSKALEYGRRVLADLLERGY